MSWHWEPGDGVVERVVLVELLGVGGGVVEDVYRVPGGNLGPARWCPGRTVPRCRHSSRKGWPAA